MQSGSSEESEGEDEDDDEMYLPSRARSTYSRGRVPLTPPDSSRRTSEAEVDRSLPQPNHQYHDPYPQTPESRQGTFIRLQHQYLGNHSKITDVFSSIAHGNDYSFFRSADSSHLVSPAASRGSSSASYFSSHHPSQSQSLQGYHEDELSNLCHPHQSFDNPLQQYLPTQPYWQGPSQQLQYVTAMSNGYEEDDTLDGGSLMIPESTTIVPSQSPLSAHHDLQTEEIGMDRGRVEYDQTNMENYMRQCETFYASF